MLARQAPRLRQLATSDREIGAEVDRAAAKAFVQAGVRSTASRSGILIYVSLFERRVVIFADEQAHQALMEDGIRTLRDIAVRQLQKGDFAQTFLQAIEVVGRRLENSSLAQREINPNELANHLLTFHPRP